MEQRHAATVDVVGVFAVSVKCVCVCFMGRRGVVWRTMHYVMCECVSVAGGGPLIYMQAFCQTAGMLPDDYEVCHIIGDCMREYSALDTTRVRARHCCGECGKWHVL